MIVEYMLIKEMDVKRAPSWVEDGGYFQNPDDFTLIGWTPNLGQRDYYVPDTVVTLTRAELVTRQLAIHAAHPAQDVEGNAITEQQVTDMVNAWCDAHGE